jgi:lipopolysaccharide exporter
MTKSDQTEATASQPQAKSFARDLLKLASGTTVAQLLGGLATPVITRLFAPEALGVSALFVSVAGIVVVIACLRYENAILLPEKDEDAANVFFLSAAMVTLVTLAMIPPCWFGARFFVPLLNAPELAPYVPLVPLGVFTGGMILALNAWNTRRKRFGRITLAQVTATTGTVCTQIGAGAMGASTGGGLIAGSLVGSGLCGTVLLIQTVRDSAALFRGATFQKMLAAAKRYNRFPKYTVLSSVLNALSWQMPTFLLAAFFTTAVVGQYSLGNRLLRLPMSLIGANISRVFFQRAAEARLRGNLPHLVQTTLQYLVTATLFPCLLLTLISKDIFVLLFGARWAEAGIYAQILSPFTFFWFLAAPLNPVLPVLEEQAVELKFEIINFITRVLSLVVGGLLGRARLTLVLFSVSGVIVHGLYCAAILKKAHVPFSTVFDVLAPQLAMAIPAGLVIAATKYSGVPPLTVLAVSGLLLILYYARIVHTSPGARQAFNEFAKLVPLGRWS